jgi:two-component system, OmpR family, phosphate regulon sensor histidine kinase PhoR
LQERKLLATQLAHDMRQPLQAIYSFLQVILGERVGPLTEQQRDFLETMSGAVKRLEAIVEDMQQLLADTQGMTLNCESVDLREHVHTCVAELQPLALSRNVMIIIDDDGADWTIHADPLRLDQILINLLENAVLYSPFCSPIKLVLTRSGTKKLLRIDNSSTLSEDTSIERWFDPGFRDRAAARDQHGSGLGLSIVSHLIAAHGWGLLRQVRDGTVSIGFEIDHDCSD